MTEHIHTLQEFMMHTKNIAYLLAPCYLISIVFFYKFLFKEDPEDED